MIFPVKMVPTYPGRSGTLKLRGANTLMIWSPVYSALKSALFDGISPNRDTSTLEMELRAMSSYLGPL